MNLKENYLEFEQEISQRGIQHLIHFTPTINLLSIFEQGKILSRDLLERFVVDQTDIFDYVEFTDEMRFDDKHYINLSIQHPNSFLFNRFQQKTADQSHINWCVLKIDSKYIYEVNTLFSITNAANSHNKRTVGVTGDILKFKKMFSDPIQVVTSYGSRNVARNGLPSKYPTDEQAEVLVKNEIPVSAILQICFRTQIEMARAKAALSDYYTSNFVVDESLFQKVRT
ncbi:DarT ssDNA thymidine ADP-ribosyltransferase family protein [Epilithonimonas vandammei]|uniref:DarT ssDNA thymidine ADP-ribosyltransferase family protein n=1 Tax=Epilithonimonas vandammei TaxID=2487072 RepID=UPI0028AD5C00|nr:DarT ssDNA thymidine ADP-ribosyltransferase family protein [Epilithonimonas vandammei]